MIEHNCTGNGDGPFLSAAAAPSPPCSVATGLALSLARDWDQKGTALENNSFGFPFDYERKDIPRTRRFDWEKMLPAKQQAVASAYPKLTLILKAAEAAASEYIGERAVVVDFHILRQRYGSPGGHFGWHRDLHERGIVASVVYLLSHTVDDAPIAEDEASIAPRNFLKTALCQIGSASIRFYNSPGDGYVFHSGSYHRSLLPLTEGK